MNLSRINLRGVRAFTLPELLLTAAILAYSLSVILVTYTKTIVLNESSRNLTTAVSHADTVMENIRNTTFGSIAANISGGTWNWNSAAITANGLTALKTEAIAVTSTGSNPLDVTVTITWQDLNGRNRSTALKTTVSG